MTTSTTVAPLPDVTPVSPLRQTLALAGAEWRLLRRNTVAMLNTLLLPGVLVLFLAEIAPAENLGFGQVAPVLVLGMALIFVVYYTLVTALVARREASVLQRLRTGECGDGTILAGLALPFAVVTIAQTALVVVGAGLVLDVGVPPNLVLVAAATLLGTLLWALLGMVSTGFTRSVEQAQITTMPLIFVALLFSGMSFPLTLLPEWGRTLARLTPMHPVVDLMRLGMAGVDADGHRLDLAGTFAAAAVPTAVLLAWIGVCAWWVARHLPWEPSR